MKIVVIGGNVLIGSNVAEWLLEEAHEVLPAALETGVNILTGQGLDSALEGAAVVVDVSNSPSFEDDAAIRFFETAGAKIAKAEQAAGVRHHVALSVVGTDRLQASGYFRAKLAQEKMIASASIPYTILRATQFFEFLRGIAGFSGDGSTVRLPSAQFQPMAARDVSAAVAHAAVGTPKRTIVEVAGPDAYRLDELVRRVLEFDEDRRTVVTDPSAPYFGVSIDDLTLMPGSQAQRASTGFDWWLANAPAPSPRS
jgi:uncharacterized protein YbjT (DUF2867 family)